MVFQGMIGEVGGEVLAPETGGLSLTATAGGVAQTAAGGYMVVGATANLHKMAATPTTTNSSGGSSGGGTGPATERHHQLPRAFKSQFEKAGLNIEEYAIDLSKDAHRLKPKGLHTGKGTDNWNGAWKQFFGLNPNANKAQILGQLSKMRKLFGLD